MPRRMTLPQFAVLWWMISSIAAQNSDTGKNLALTGVAAQSTIWADYTLAAKAIDGNLDSDFRHHSCSSTQDELSPWWRVNLLDLYRISRVVITNRGDCCGERLNGANILIGNSLENNGNNNPRCTEISSIPDGETQTFQCNGMVGQYVNIVLPGKQEQLQLCEVQVFGDPEPSEKNLALNGLAEQSTTWLSDTTASQAIDGNPDSNWEHHSCSSTEDELSPWWRVNLLEPYRISRVVITNRGDCCGEILNGANILIGNSLENNGNNNPRCAEISSITNGETQTFQCNGMVGQYVNIVLPGKQQKLQLCEVQVFGDPEPDTRKNLALNGVAAQSTNWADYTAATKAIDGIPDYNFSHHSCSSTEDELSPWWRVNLLAPYRISHVVITNRGDCCGESLNGANILIGNSLENNGNDNPWCAEISSITNGETRTFQCNGMVGQYVNIVQLEKQQKLQLCEVQVFGDPVPSGTNLALHGVAAQSTTWASYSTATKAIDGNPDSNFRHLSCSSTHEELSPWWRVDLLEPYRISRVVITNRGDCCGERLNGAKILIGNSLENNGNDNPRCEEISSITKGVTWTFQCNGMVGQYVNIVQPGKQEQLQLCEVQVFGDPLPSGKNLALNGWAAQSTTWTSRTAAAKAIDGNPDSNFRHHSCSSTLDELSPWWRVDLSGLYRISHIVITNRGDCCGQSLNGANILIGNSWENNGNNNPRCAEISSIANGETQTFQCNGMVGQYVNIVLPGKQQKLQLCEVQVFGDLAPSGENVALQGRATQSSVYRSNEQGYLAAAMNAIDGNLDTNFIHGSCSHTHNDPSPWWRVDLLKPYSVCYIIITNRGDCCGHRLNGAEILVGNSLANNGNDNPRCAVVTSIPTRGSRTFHCNGMVGRFVNIILRGKSDFLQLCEVEVFAPKICDKKKNN